MLKPQLLGVITLTLALAAPAMAQQPATPAQPVPAQPATIPPATTPPGVVATTNNPNLSVATVRLENGTRTSKLIGSAVYSDGNERIGSLDDLIMTEGNRVTVAIVSVGGFLGLGSKLVAFPFGQLRMEADKVVLPGATKESLNGMPGFMY